MTPKTPKPKKKKKKGKKFEKNSTKGEIVGRIVSIWNHKNNKST